MICFSLPAAVLCCCWLVGWMVGVAFAGFVAVCVYTFFAGVAVVVAVVIGRFCG